MAYFFIYMNDIDKKYFDYDKKIQIKYNIKIDSKFGFMGHCEKATKKENEKLWNLWEQLLKNVI